MPAKPYKPIETLTLTTLESIDRGALKKAIEASIRSVALDISDRCGNLDKKPRKVVLTLIFEPQVDIESNTITKVLTSFEIVKRVPAMKSKATSMRVDLDGNLLFKPDSPANFNQANIGEVVDAETGEVK